MAHQLSSYSDFRRVFRRTARAATQVLSTHWFSNELEAQSVDADLVELCCLELKHKTELENALYESAYDSMPSISVAQ